MIAFIIYGSRGITSVQGSGQFHCPACQGPCHFEHKTVRRYFTLYFIPIIPLNVAGEYIECTLCRGSFDMAILNHSPAPGTNPGIAPSTDIVEAESVGRWQDDGQTSAPSQRFGPDTGAPFGAQQAAPFGAQPPASQFGAAPAYGGAIDASGQPYQPGTTQKGKSPVLWIVLGVLGVLLLCPCGLLIPGLIPGLMMGDGNGQAQNRPDFPEPDFPEPNIPHPELPIGGPERPAFRAEPESQPSTIFTFDSALDALESDDSTQREQAARWIARKSVDESKRNEVASALENTHTFSGQIDDAALSALGEWAIANNVPRLLDEFETAEGTRRSNIIGALIATSDMRAAPVFAESMNSSASAEALRSLGPNASAHVLPYVNDSNMLRSRIANELITEWDLGPDVLVIQSVTDLASDDPKQVKAAAKFLSELEFETKHQPQISSGLEICLKRTDVELCTELATAMFKWQQGDSSAAALTAAMTGTVEKEYRFTREAIKALGETGSNSVAPALVAAVIESQSRSDALEAIRKLDSAVVIDAVLPFMNIADYSARSTIVTLLNEINTPQKRMLAQCATDLSADDIKKYDPACDWLDDQDVDPNQRDAVAAGLNHAIATLISDPDGQRQLRPCLELAGKWGNDSTAEALVPVMRNENLVIAIKAIEMLGELDNPATYDAIAKLLFDTRLKHHASRAIDSIGINAESTLLPYIENENKDSRTMIYRLLGDIGGDESLKVLKRRIKSEDFEDISEKTMIEMAIRNIERRPAEERKPPSPSAPDGPIMRTWTDNTGGNKIEGKLITYENNRAHLEVNGEIFKTELLMLSEKDRDYVLREIERRKK